MKVKAFSSQVVAAIALAAVLLGCTDAQNETPTAAVPQAPTPSKPTDYEFPDAIDVSQQYLFYLHGKIIEDQGIPAISPVFVFGGFGSSPRRDHPRHRRWSRDSVSAPGCVDFTDGAVGTGSHGMNVHGRILTFLLLENGGDNTARTNYSPGNHV